MLPPEEFFHSQVCTKCLRYLSVFPIKNYHDKSVKCGRCSKQDDGGVESHLTEMILQNIKFPCNNHLAGCKEELRPYEMRNHLEECNETDYTCPICKSFTGIPLQLLRHCERKHSQNKLLTPSFIITSENDERIFFYRQQWIFAFVTVSYSFSTFYFRATYLGHQDRGEVWQEVDIGLISKEILQSNIHLPPQPCGSLHHDPEPEGLLVAPLKSSTNLIVVNFRLIEKPLDSLTSLSGPLVLYNQNSTVKYTFRHTYPNILDLEMDTDHYMPMQVIILGHALRVSIYTTRQKMFQVYLEWGGLRTKSSEKCKVFARCYVSSKLCSKMDESLDTPLKAGTFLGLLEVDRNYLTKENDPNEVHVKVLVKLVNQPKQLKY
ncbi:uncharacterized protein LOC126736288 [Anthonomus grandis grandis]|uniref:uncharacterized protein LOC126736288 n=1 Tax=Anthonomus grandis grandis TaxID=2921223 RepID=UPI0021663838|nr:uncharacterized protein LOC126736288 [Anthonomus grandis grandis]